MIDWLDLLFNSLWLIALALALAALSAAGWRASAGRTGWRAELAQPGTRTALHAAGSLFCLGLGLTAAAWWETVVWLAGAAAFLVLLLRGRQPR